MQEIMRLPPWARIALIALAALAVGRSVALVRHDPLLALANSYDQIRYSACLDLAPWRPGVQADRANPPAPYSRFAFQKLPKGTCMWTSDLAFTAPVAAMWRVAEALGARKIHSVQRLAEWRLLVWLAVAIWATRFFLRERRVDLALAHLGGFALFAMDPANTLYLGTFYAEAAGAFGCYACLVGIAAGLVRPTRVALAVTAIGALMLATSKFQHLVLPIVLAAAVWLGARRAGRAVVLALLAGGALGFGVQLANGLRSTPMAHNIDMVNRADYTLLVLLPEASDRARIVDALAMNDECVAFSGKSVYAMPGPVDKTCTTIDRWRYVTLWWLLISDPPALGRALLHIPRLLLPWQPTYLGAVEGAEYGKLPAWLPSLDLLFQSRIAFAWFLLSLPWLVVVICFVRRASPVARAFALACASGMAGVCVVALLGDGDVEFAKHVHLAINFALASLCLPIAAGFRRFLPESHG